MKLIVGLGNPGKKYDGTRHNIGFDILDIYARKHNIPTTKVKFKSYIGEGFIKGEKVILMKPQTYMNLSGEAVLAAVEYYDLEMEDVIVIYDDIDVDVGKLRIRKKGSAGSHNGMKNIIYLLQENTFPRFRIGVGRPGRQDLANYVLCRFPKEEHEIMTEVVERSMDALDELLENGVDAAMNRYNG